MEIRPSSMISPMKEMMLMALPGQGQRGECADDAAGDGEHADERREEALVEHDEDHVDTRTSEATSAQPRERKELVMFCWSPP